MSDIDEMKIKPTSKHTILEKVRNQIISNNAYTLGDIREDQFNPKDAAQRSSDSLNALNATTGLQTMLAAQMVSIHQLQQKTMLFANAFDNIKLNKYYANSAVKLANCFTQQAQLLAKLQGVNTQKITVERVDVRNGGQAIVGNFNNKTSNTGKK